MVLYIQVPKSNKKSNTSKWFTDFNDWLCQQISTYVLLCSGCVFREHLYAEDVDEFFNIVLGKYPSQRYKLYVLKMNIKKVYEPQIQCFIDLYGIGNFCVTNVNCPISNIMMVKNVREKGMYINGVWCGCVVISLASDFPKEIHLRFSWIFQGISINKFNPQIPQCRVC